MSFIDCPLINYAIYLLKQHTLLPKCFDKLFFYRETGNCNDGFLFLTCYFSLLREAVVEVNELSPQSDLFV